MVFEKPDASSRWQVNLLRWDGSAWMPWGGSNPQAAISASASDSILPSVGFLGSDLPIVEWQEGNSAAFPRWWNGSAWTPLGGPASASIDPTPGFSHFPRLAIGAASVPTVVWVKEGGEIYVRQHSDLYLTDLQQRRSDESALLSLGETILEGSISLAGTGASALPVSSENRVRLQIEVRRIHEPFAGIPTAEGNERTLGEPLVVSLNSLSPGRYHWRGRLKRPSGRVSSWISFGGNADEQADFVIEGPEKENNKGLKDVLCGTPGGNIRHGAPLLLSLVILLLPRMRRARLSV